MRKTLVVSIAMGLMMVSAAVLTKAVTPTVKLAAGRQAVDLAAIVPTEIGQWIEDRTQIAAVVNPQTEEALNKIYAQTLSRTYVNPQGDRIMLSIAYGSDQAGEDTQVHRPEFCYAAQGFTLGKYVDGGLHTADGTIPVRRMVAMQGGRIEPITYWITVGDKATLPGLGRKLAQLSYGLNGAVPDGLLFRISSINSDEKIAYEAQDDFINSLFEKLSPQQRIRLAGRLE